VLFVLVHWLIGRTTQPLALLSQWAKHLGDDLDQSLYADYPIAELDDLTAQLHETSVIGSSSAL
jgi:hypothetical protein